MPRPTKADLFDQARAYLDTDELNFPDTLLDLLCKRIWFQAVSMEREWRFFQRTGTADVPAGGMCPMTFTVGTTQMPATRLYTVYWDGCKLPWTEYTTAAAERYNGVVGKPVMWTEFNDGVNRNIVLFPTPSADGVVTADFYAEPVYPTNDTDPFGDLPEEFDSALLEGLLGDMYYREEDADLGDMHSQMFSTQMGSIRARWRRSIQIPLQVAVGGLRPTNKGYGFSNTGAFTQPPAVEAP